VVGAAIMGNVVVLFQKAVPVTCLWSLTKRWTEFVSSSPWKLCDILVEQQYETVVGVVARKAFRDPFETADAALERSQCMVFWLLGFVDGAQLVREGSRMQSSLHQLLPWYTPRHPTGA
jgi:hypothetical protein